MKKRNIIISALMLLFATTASAQYVHIELKDGTKRDFDSKDIKTMIVDNEFPKPSTPQAGYKVEGTVTVGDNTYTKAVGGTVGEAVDLGLKVKWASHNIGASQPEEYGAYLAWAEMGTKEEGYVDGVKYNKEGKPYYGYNNLKYSTSTSSTYYKYDKFTKYVASSSYGEEDNLNVLEAMDDAATVNWGGEWRMPTYDEQTELRTKCTWIWVTTDVKDAKGNYIKGYKVVGPNGNSIFLPASGCRYNDSLFDVGSYGFYWSSSLCTNLSHYAYILRFDSKYVGWYDDGRYDGRSVRPVRSK